MGFMAALSALRGSGGALGNLFEGVEQLACEVVDARGEDPEAGCELVVGDSGGYSDEDARCCGDERFADAGGDGAQGC